MLTERDACHLVLHELDHPEAFVVQSCSLSTHKYYWVVRANSADYVLRGNVSQCYVGVNAYLVDVRTGAIDIVGSNESVHSYLQDKYDLREAAGRHYVLRAAFARSDKRAIIHLHQALACTLQRARELSEEDCDWLTGIRGHLRDAQELLRQKGIATSIELVDKAESVRPIDHRTRHWEELKNLLRH